MNDNSIIVENARLIFKNFSGNEGPYNTAGVRSFSLLLDTPELIQLFGDAGFNIKPLRMREEDTEQHYHLPVAVSYKAIPPEVYLVTANGKVPLTEETIGNLDYSQIELVDLSIRPRFWELNGNSGIKAYLKKMFVTINQDPLDLKYAD